MSGIDKTIKYHSYEIDNNSIKRLEETLFKRESCRNYFFSRFSGIEYMDKLNFRDIRDYLINNEKNEMKKFNLPARTWKMELSEVISNIKSMWSNMENEIKHYIRDNKNLSDEDRHYLFYILKCRDLWSEVLRTQSVTETKKLSQINVSNKKYLYNLLCRYTRKTKPKISYSTELKSMQLDTQMYSLKDGLLGIQTYESGNKVFITLKNNVSCNKGNIRIVLNRKDHKLEVHKCIKIEPKEKTIVIHEIGLDKGYSVMFSCSSENEYGIVLGELLSMASDFVNEKNKKRNKYHSKIREMEKELKENHKLTNEQKNVIQTKIEKIKTNNLSDKSYRRRRNRDKEIIKSYVNHEIKRMILTEQPTTIALEDLTFETDSGKDKGKNFNRKMSSWIKGYIDERVNYYAKLYNIKVEYVTAAYTSQFCAECGARFIERCGEHHEIAICPNCGKINSNTNSGKQILSRLHDKEVTLYTPYKDVEQIMVNRYEEKRKKNNLLKPQPKKMKK